jgi:hypothetical protein
MKAYSALDVTVVISALPAIPAHEVTHYADGDDAIMITRREDAITDKVGMDGRMSIARNANRSGEVTLKLMQTSPTNHVLTEIHTLQQQKGGQFVPISLVFQDTNRQDRAAAVVGYIKKLPEIQRGAGVNTQEWVIVSESLDVRLGDPTFAGLPSAGAEAL